MRVPFASCWPPMASSLVRSALPDLHGRPSPEPYSSGDHDMWAAGVPRATFLWCFNSHPRAPSRGLTRTRRARPGQAVRDVCLLPNCVARARQAGACTELFHSRSPGRRDRESRASTCARLVCPCRVVSFVRAGQARAPDLFIPCQDVSLMPSG